MEEPNQQIPCPKCNFPILTSFNFCPNCGKKFKDPPFSMGILERIGLCLLSLFLPPVGLWPGFKFLFNSDRKAQAFGIILIALTVVSIVVSTWFMLTFVNSQIKELQTQIQVLQNAGL